MLDEGYIKYQSKWTVAPAPFPDVTQQLENSRRPLIAAGLVGHYEDLGIGFGNISIRCGDPGQFLITGTQTGHIDTTTEQHYSLVTQYDIEGNQVSCRGPVQASSEAMTHAAIYELDPSIAAIVHVHSKTLWDKYLNKLPTTNPDVAYGTPEMAGEFRRLFTTSLLGAQGLTVMGGHEEGLIAIGESLEQATARILALADSD